MSRPVSSTNPNKILPPPLYETQSVSWGRFGQKKYRVEIVNTDSSTHLTLKIVEQTALNRFKSFITKKQYENLRERKFEILGNNDPNLSTNVIESINNKISNLRINRAVLDEQAIEAINKNVKDADEAYLIRTLSSLTLEQKQQRMDAFLTYFNTASALNDESQTIPVLKLKGILRLSGNDDLIKLLQIKLLKDDSSSGWFTRSDSEATVDVKDTENRYVHGMANTFKRFIKICDFSEILKENDVIKHKPNLSNTESIENEKLAIIKTLSENIRNMDPNKQNLLKTCLTILKNISDNHTDNNMNTGNISILFSPNITKLSDKNQEELTKDSITITKVLLENYHQIFESFNSDEHRKTASDTVSNEQLADQLSATRATIIPSEQAPSSTAAQADELRKTAGSPPSNLDAQLAQDQQAPVAGSTKHTSTRLSNPSGPSEAITSTSTGLTPMPANTGKNPSGRSTSKIPKIANSTVRSLTQNQSNSVTPTKQAQASSAAAAQANQLPSKVDESTPALDTQLAQVEAARAPDTPGNLEKSVTSSQADLPVVAAPASHKTGAPKSAIPNGSTTMPLSSKEIQERTAMIITRASNLIQKALRKWIADANQPDDCGVQYSIKRNSQRKPEIVFTLPNDPKKIASFAKYLKMKRLTFELSQDAATNSQQYLLSNSSSISFFKLSGVEFFKRLSDDLLNHALIAANPTDPSKPQTS